MKDEQWRYIFELLDDRLYQLDERTEQDWIECDDPKGKELKFLKKTIEDLITWLN
tara:strand:+ start:336 stop:500 length:165 start_codon:yes stop_codon:yes gene_type:complete